MLTFALTALVLMSVVGAADATTYAENEKLTAFDGAAGHHFGESVAVSGDTAVIGAQENGINGERSGAAYVFARSGGSWIQQAILTPSDAGPGQVFGDSVAISGDTILVGATGDSDNGNWAGAAYVFTRTGTTWTQEAKLKPSDGAPGDNIGNSVAISGDTALLGAHLKVDEGEPAGSAYVFHRVGTSWTQQARLTPSDSSVAWMFGVAVSISGDTAIAGAPSDRADGRTTGSVYVFSRSGTTWTLEAKLGVPDTGVRTIIGWAITVSGDTLVIGRHGHSSIGQAHVFTRRNGTWTHLAQLTAADGSVDDLFGVSVAAYGDTILIGASTAGDREVRSGSAYVFTRDDNTWTQDARLTASDAANYDNFGYAVALESGTALIGALGDDDYGDESGSAYVFDLSSPVIATRPPVVDADFDFGHTFPSGKVTLTGTVNDDAPVRWVRVAIRDRVTRLWLQDDMVSWGRFNRFPTVLADPTAAATTWSFEVDLPDGTYALSARTKDRDGNAANIRPWRRFNVGDDVTPPTIDADFAFGAQFESPARLTGTATDDRQVVRVRVAIRDRATRLWLRDDGVSWGRFNRFAATLSDPGKSSTAWSFAVDLPPGDYSLSARATDLLGNESSIRPWRHFSIKE